LKYRLIGLLLILFSSLYSTCSYAQDMTEPEIRVGIFSNQPNVVVSANTDFSIVSQDDKKVIGKYVSQQKVTISSLGTNITINGVAVNAKHLSVIFRADKGEYYTEVNKRRYRGQIHIHQTNMKNGLTVVNALPVELYLYGVIAKEISPDWPFEAVKAQAVAARTYALNSMNKHKDDGYDVCATTDCQVYGGIDSEAPGALKAVDVTYGQAIFYQSKLISAYFHSSSGGFTENSENVWGAQLPYLRGVVDFDQNTPQYKWEKQFSVSELEDLLTRAGYKIGKLTAIELSPLSKPPVNSADRGISGRVKEVGLIGTTGNVYLTGNKLRSILSLKSTLFDIGIVVPAQKTLEFEITDSFGDHQTKEVPVNLPSLERKEFLDKRNSLRRVTGQLNEKITFSGFGWGHGLGLSQWGAKVMAETAPHGDDTYFKKILKHYYQGVDIQRAY